MLSSLFLSPAFIFAESTFIIVASIALYELLVGDFIWAQQAQRETTRQRTSMQSRRGGYATFQRRQMQLQDYRSLSPGGRGIGPRITPSRRSSSEELSLLPPSCSRGGHRDTRVSEEGYYSSSSPSDTTGRGSSGDITRRLFYKAILVALLSRFILLPVETFVSFNIDSNINNRENTINSILLRISQTLPDVAFASALGLLVFFCGQIAFAAMPPTASNANEGCIRCNDAAETLDDGISGRVGVLSKHHVEEQEILEGVCVANRLKRHSQLAQKLCTRFLRTILASKKTHVTWNLTIFTSYTFVFVAELALPHTPLATSEISLWLFMIAIHAFLLLSLVYVAVLLGKALRTCISRRNNLYSLAIRLVVTSTLLGIMFVDRVVSFGMAAHSAISCQYGFDRNASIRTGYRRSTIEYVISESLPVLVILFMMHRKRKEIRSDVHILWSLFGNAGRIVSPENSQLDPIAMSSASGNGVNSAVVGFSLRYQTHEGRISFPPSGIKTGSHVRRASSSSGGGV